jgi:hypothetical protein
MELLTNMANHTNEWHWEEEDSKAAKQYLADVKSGKAKPILITRSNIESVLRRD